MFKGGRSCGFCKEQDEAKVAGRRRLSLLEGGEEGVAVVGMRLWLWAEGLGCGCCEDKE